MISLVQLPEQAVPGLLDGSFPPGVYTWQPDVPATAMNDALQWAAGAGWHGAALNLAQVGNKAEFLQRCADDLQLPEWFRYDWDALADCLTDLSWWRRSGGFLLLAGSWRAFQETAPDEATTAAEIIAAAADYWAARDKPLAALLG